MEKPVAVNRCLAITMQSIFQKTNAPNAPIVLNNLGLIFPYRPPVSRLAGFLFLFKSCRPLSLGRCPKRTGRDPRALDRSTLSPDRRPLSAVRVPSGVVRCAGSRSIFDARSRFAVRVKHLKVFAFRFVQSGSGTVKNVKGSLRYRVKIHGKFAGDRDFLTAASALRNGSKDHVFDK